MVTFYLGFSPAAATKSGFPTSSDLNARLRRLIASYQRENRKEAARKAQRDKKQMDRRERIEQAVRDREQKKRDVEQRWSRREESELYKVRRCYVVVGKLTRTHSHSHSQTGTHAIPIFS